MTAFIAIRPAGIEDRQSLLDVQVAAGLFPVEAIGEIGKIFDRSFADDGAEAHRWIVAESNAALVGGAYFSREEVSDNVWNLLMIAVMPDAQGSGVGEQLVEHVEAAISEAGGRILLVETSSTDQFERTRAFYERLGFGVEARIRGYFGPGDDKIIFWKSLGE